MLNRSKLWAATLLLGVFAAGLALGGPVWNLLEDYRDHDQRRRGDASESRDREHKSYAEHLQEGLDLSATQRVAVDAILNESQSAMRAVWREMRSEIDTLRQEVSQEILTLLNEDQQTKYREMISRDRRRGSRDRESREDRNHD